MVRRGRHARPLSWRIRLGLVLIGLGLPLGLSAGLARAQALDPVTELGIIRGLLVEALARTDALIADLSATTTTTTILSTTTTTGPTTTTSTTVSTTTTTGPTTTTTTTTPPAGGELCGSVGGTIPAGETWVWTCDVTLTGDLVVEGLLTNAAVPLRLDGAGHQILVRRGGRLQLAGEPMTAWIGSGEAPLGWEIGDRIAVAPWTEGVYVPLTGGTWQGEPFPAEIANVERSIVIDGVSRIQIEDGAGAQSLRWLAIRDAGVEGVLGQYPLHFHLLGDLSRGSLVEGVVVEGGKNHAYISHESHGITYRDVAAVDTISHAYWWDPDARTDDVRYEHAFALGVTAPAVLDLPSNGAGRLSAFRLGEGTGNAVVDSVAVGVRGGGDSSGFHWPEDANGSNSIWLFEDNVAHNNNADGIFVWQNDPSLHVITRFRAYNSGDWGIQHGAYKNRYRYESVTVDGIRLQATSRSDGPVEFAGVASSAELLVSDHVLPDVGPVIFRDCSFPLVRYREVNDGRITVGSTIEFHDCGLSRADVIFELVNPASVTVIIEDEVIIARAVGGVWQG